MDASSWSIVLRSIAIWSLTAALESCCCDDVDDDIAAAETDGRDVPETAGFELLPEFAIVVVLLILALFCGLSSHIAAAEPVGELVAPPPSSST